MLGSLLLDKAKGNGPVEDLIKGLQSIDDPVRSRGAPNGVTYAGPGRWLVYNDVELILDSPY